MEIREVIRRWRQGENARSIAEASGLARNTVDKYLRLAVAARVTRGGEPPGEELYAALSRCSQPGPRPGSRLAPQRTILGDRRERIAHWLQDDHLRLTRIHELLLRDGIAAGYTTLREFVRDEGLWKPSLSTVRMADWAAGEVAEMDFGRLGSIVDAAHREEADDLGAGHRPPLQPPPVRLATAPANPGGEHRRAGNGVALLRWLAQAAHPR